MLGPTALNKFVDDAKSGEAVDRVKARVTIQKDVTGKRNGLTRTLHSSTTTKSCIMTK